MKSSYALALAVALASGCYLKPSATNNPLTGSDGVRVTLVGQDCEDHRGGDGDPVSRALGIKLRVENPTDKPLRIAERSIRLLVEGNSRGVRWPTVVDIQPHSAATVTMDFAHDAVCEADQQFVVAWNDALVLDQRPIKLANLAFRP
jgi:hypothetical protein